MNQQNSAFFAVIGLAVTIAWVIISWYNYRLKKRIIDSGPLNDEALGFVKKLSGSGTEALKWGCIIFSAGMGLVVIDFIKYDNGSSLPFGIEAMFIAAGFLVYYFALKKQQQP
ncbi:hypothetical protein [Mucilaginibacter sp.]|uniref:hypothetical protein n=1 Tax=Mucilaginibacter sp. TaxID=1882438 RepID=UPI002627E65E|nr:hypothetical protein [Mucilaginibacter sp.]MDB4918318.1 hypothetical protein [Mucilaginibacter sp.]